MLDSVLFEQCGKLQAAPYVQKDVDLADREAVAAADRTRFEFVNKIVAKVESCDEKGLALCSLNNKFSQGTELEVVGPDLRPFTVTADTMTDLEGNVLEEPRTPQMQFYLQLPKPVPALSMIRRAVDLSAK